MGYLRVCTILGEPACDSAKFSLIRRLIAVLPLARQDGDIACFVLYSLYKYIADGLFFLGCC